MTFAQILFTACGAAAIASGIRRSRYDGIPAHVWWEQERQYRRPRSTLWRLARVLAGITLLIAAAAAAMTALAILIASTAAIALLAAAWFWLRQTAAKAEPPLLAVERLAAGHLTPKDLDRERDPPSAAHPGITPDDPDMPHLTLEI